MARHKIQIIVDEKTARTQIKTLSKDSCKKRIGKQSVNEILVNYLGKELDIDPETLKALLTEEGEKAKLEEEGMAVSPQSGQSGKTVGFKPQEEENKKKLHQGFGV